LLCKQQMRKLNQTHAVHLHPLTSATGCPVTACVNPLQSLDLCCNQIMRPGALAVARVLAARAKAAGGSKLQLLALDENAISEAGVEQLRALLTVRGSTAAVRHRGKRAACLAGSMFNGHDVAALSCS
jgi:phosphoribosylcarboxyaminoimidazole (NCAIR) mutase